MTIAGAAPCSSRARRLASVGLAAALFVSASCGDDTAGCEDDDLDGFGAGCPAGPDCDDHNATRNVDCVTVPPPDCAADPFATGCPCLPSATIGCYGAPEETAGVGTCVRGRASCVSGRWGLCLGVVLPRGETCDGRDQDCDGVVDDGVLSPCGGCTPGCAGESWGDDDRPFRADPGLAVGPLGELTLAWAERVDADTVWVANSAEHTVSRIDAQAAVETARYATGGSEPSRVAVDWAGDAFVANREFEGTSTLIKIAGRPERCVDADGDGLRTSSGPTDVLPFGEDECVLWRVPVGGPRGVARALAVDGDRGLDGASGGDVWVGLHDGEEVVALDGTTGEVRATLAIPGFAPYAAAFDPWGTLWLASRDGHLARIDRRARPLVAETLEIPFPCFLLYGLAVDARGRLFLSGFSCDTALRYDPSTGAFRQATVPPSPRGVTILDGEPWLAHTAGIASRLDPTTLEVLDTIDLAAGGVTPIESVGAGADAHGRVWIASGRGVPEDVGLASRVDPSDGSVTHVRVGRSPHTQGDLTGAELAGGFVAEGTTSEVFEGCPLGGETRWLRVHVDALLGAAGSVEVSARHAADRAALASAPWAILGTLPDARPPFALSVPEGGVLEIRLVLRTSARDGAPRVRRVGVEQGCPGPE